MDSVKAQPDVLEVLLAMAGGLAVLYPIVPGLVIDFDKLLSQPVPLLVMLLVAASLEKVVHRFAGSGARIAAIVGIVAGWHLVYGTLFSHYLRF